MTGSAVSPVSSCWCVHSADHAKHEQHNTFLQQHLEHKHVQNYNTSYDIDEFVSTSTVRYH